MQMLIDLVAVVALVMAYDAARPMSGRTSHGIRAALFLRGLGAVLAIWGAIDAAVITLMVAAIVHRAFDRRFNVAPPNGRADGSCGVASLAHWGKQAAVEGGPNRHPGAGVVSLSDRREGRRGIAA